MQLPAFEVHEGDGPYALLVHGVLSSRSHWLPNLDALRTVCRPVVVELYGHGRSPSPTEPSAYHPDGYVEAFDAVRNELGAQRWFVVGHSLGAALTLRYVLDRPGNVIAHVFMNSNSALADEAWTERVRAGVETAARMIETGGQDAIRSHPLHPGRSKRLDPPVREALVRDAEQHSPTGVAGTFRHTVPPSPVRARIAENRVPALLVVGTRERQFAPHREYASQVMPMLEVVEADGGHAVSIDAAQTFNDAVTAFFGRAVV